MPGPFIDDDDAIMPAMPAQYVCRLNNQSYVCQLQRNGVHEVSLMQPPNSTAHVLHRLLVMKQGVSNSKPSKNHQRPLPAATYLV